MRERFIIVQWPEIQDFMDEDWYNKIMRLKYGKREYNKQ